ncbi:hypothetical protein C8Q77DRAFT_209240 [Trametes polyzona]|nr:hypothetical protein C8Q77DRAFT_209240 [Trametes polyzona]
MGRSQLSCSASKQPLAGSSSPYSARREKGVVRVCLIRSTPKARTTNHYCPENASDCFPRNICSQCRLGPQDSCPGLVPQSPVRPSDDDHRVVPYAHSRTLIICWTVYAFALYSGISSSMHTRCRNILDMYTILIDTCEFKKSFPITQKLSYVQGCGHAALSPNFAECPRHYDPDQKPARCAALRPFFIPSVRGCSTALCSEPEPLHGSGRAHRWYRAYQGPPGTLLAITNATSM